MYQEINFSDFCDRFRDMNRDNNFTYDGKRALFDYLENLEEDTGEKIELDIIALCCEYSEYDNLKEFQDNFSGDYETIEDIENETTVIKVGEESFIIQDF